MRALAPAFLLALTAASLCACSGARAGARSDKSAPATVTLERSPRLEPGVYEVATGERLSREDLYARLASHRFVLVGERHDDPWHHRVQRDVYAGLVDRRPGPVLLGMEMFQRPFQPALDAYVEGELDQQALLERTEWSERWRFPVEFYAPLWQRARAQPGGRVIALNARRELTRRCAQVGLEGLTEAERAELPEELVLDDQDHRAWVAQIFAMHGMDTDGEAFERFYQAQVIWDETMAQTAFEVMQGAPAEQAMLIVAGSGHVQNRWGIPARLERRLEAAGDERARVVTVMPVSAPGQGPRASLRAPTGATEADLAMWKSQGYADYVWVQ